MSGYAMQLRQILGDDRTHQKQPAAKVALSVMLLHFELSAGERISFLRMDIFSRTNEQHERAAVLFYFEGHFRDLVRLRTEFVIKRICGQVLGGPAS